MNGNISQRLAVEAEADRPCGIYIRVDVVLAKAQRIAFLEAGRKAVAKSLVSAADWEMMRLAVTGQ